MRSLGFPADRITYGHMAADAGALTGKDIVSIGGTARGADAALILKPEFWFIFMFIIK